MKDTSNVIKISETGKKIFISSTSHDLKDLRAEVAAALYEWNFQPVWSESSDFPVEQGVHKHDACLDAVKKCDIYLLIIDRRYGSVYDGNKYQRENISITWYEAKIAFLEKKKIITFVRDVVMAERNTYQANLATGGSINLYFVDDAKIFDVINWVDTQTSDNWIYSFKDSVELKNKLRTTLHVKMEIKNIYSLPFFDKFKRGW